MAQSHDEGELSTGGCLCGAVRYEVRGHLRDVLICHCQECRRRHGHFSASTAADREDLILRRERGLRWIRSPESDAGARRGFCAEVRIKPVLGCAAPGDDQHRRRNARRAQGAGHRRALVCQPGGDYYDIPADGLPRHQRSGEQDSRSSAPADD